MQDGQGSEEEVPVLGFGLLVPLVAVQGQVVSVEIAVAGLRHVGEEGAVEGVIVAGSQEVVVPGEGGVLFEVLVEGMSMKWVLSGQSVVFLTHIVSTESEFITEQISSGGCATGGIASDGELSRYYVSV